MKVTACLFVVAIAANPFVYAGHHSHGASVGKEVLVGKTAPEAVEESDRIITCPHGFKQHGKQCSHTVSIQPTVHCPLGFFRSVEDEHVCTKLSEPVFDCPADFVREKGVCVRTRQVEPLVECPQGFSIMSDGRQCSRHVPLPNKLFCPHGSIQRGEICVKRTSVAPEFVCPPRFSLVEDKRCMMVETFDCTPIEFQSGKEATSSHKHHHHLRLLGEKKFSAVFSKEIPPTEKEIVVQKTCKRIRHESARKVCPKGSAHDGKECKVEEEVQFHEKNGGTREEIVKAIFICPEGHFPSSSVGWFSCLIKEEIPVHGLCPDNSQIVNHRCAKYRPLILRCPSDHKLQDQVCVKTITAPPIIEFNRTFKCSGKDCDHHIQTH